MSQVAGRLVLAAAVCLAAGSIGANVWAHGDVTPQAVDTSALPDIGEAWLTKNPYRDDPKVYAAAQKIGQSAYGGNCARCHGLEGISGGIAPDLRYLDAGEAGDEWYMERYRHGSSRDGKVYMPPMGDTLGQKAGWAIRSWLDSKHEG
jgi:cytochrome c-550 PedF